MHKFVLPLAASLAVASPAFAAAEAGPYVGAGVTSDNISGTGSAEGIGFGGVGGTVFAGYNLPLGDTMFAGVEANFNLSSADVGNKVNGVKVDNAFGVTGRFGYNLSDSAAFFGRAGYQRARASSYINSAKTSASRDGLLLGAGLEANLSPKIAVRVEYDHTHFYRDKAVDPANTGLANDQATVGLVIGF